ncbi:MAG: DUF885 domain-containing protein [Pseudomonadota bacterium]
MTQISRLRGILPAMACALLLPACSPNATTPEAPAEKAMAPGVGKNAGKQSFTETEKANAFFEAAFLAQIMRSPQSQSYLGIKADYDKWDDNSEEHQLGDVQLAQEQLETLRQSIDYDELDDQAKLSYRLFEYLTERSIGDYEYRHYNYPVNQMFGVQSGTPAFLINIHRITNESDARAYIARLEGMEMRFKQITDGMRLREEKGILPPKFVFDYVINDSRNVLSGAPFDDSGEDNLLLADFKKKITALKLEPETRGELIEAATKALLDSVGPAYRSLIELCENQASRATTDDGAWKFPDGAAFYKRALRNTTTTDLSAEEIHEIGLREVGRIHDEMRDIMKQVDFEGSLQDFFAFTREDKRFYFDEGEEGQKAYLTQVNVLLDGMEEKLPEYFSAPPKAKLVVKAVEPFREKSAGKAFYQRPSPDGSRPGTYYANLYRMSDMPIYQMEALAYHEGIPGHHLQLAAAQELGDVPKFRQFARFTAYSEGWGLYAELLPKEMGFYEDPYSDFGRLAMELWRACRLVVDTGIHNKRWTREEAIDYLATNTPNPQGDVVKAIERYIVSPSQATAYKIGMLKIVELKAKAEDALGENFDIRRFHDMILGAGPMPLSFVEQRVDAYIEAGQ